MIPINFEINSSKVKVTVAFNLMIYRPNLVQMITTDRIYLGPQIQYRYSSWSVNDPYRCYNYLNIFRDDVDTSQSILLISLNDQYQFLYQSGRRGGMTVLQTDILSFFQSFKRTTEL